MIEEIFVGRGRIKTYQFEFQIWDHTLSLICKKLQRLGATTNAPIKEREKNKERKEESQAQIHLVRNDGAGWCKANGKTNASDILARWEEFYLPQLSELEEISLMLLFWLKDSSLEALEGVCNFFHGK